jgi:head-tail adaptor
MILLTNRELDAMSEVAEETMLDTCVVQTATTTYDTVGGAVRTWSNGASSACGVRFTSERRPESVELAGVRYDVDATIRLPLAVTVTTLQRLKVTTRAGRTLLDPWTFEVLGIARQGPSANVIKARQVSA